MLIERRGLTTPERVNKVISGEKLGTDTPSRFLRRLQKTAGFGTTAVVGKAVIRQLFIRQMPASIRAHLATTPSVSQKRQNNRKTFFSPLTLMRDHLHLAWLQIIIVTKIMNKMLLPQKYQIPARPLRRRTRCQTGTA